MYFDVTFQEAKSLICLFVISSVGFPHLRSPDIVTPRYLAADKLSSSVLWRKY